jgi:biotin carboxyl carrier protein
MKQYTVRIGESEYLIARHPNGTMHVNGKVVDASVNARGEGRFDIRLGEHIFDIDILSRDEDGIVEMLVNGKVIQAQVDDEKATLLKKYSFNQKRQHHTSHIKAPMPGKIVNVLVQPGDPVAAGQGVLILEAMKMENEIKSPSAGVVKTVNVRDNDAVEKNTLLMEIE